MVRTTYYGLVGVPVIILLAGLTMVVSVMANSEADRYLQECHVGNWPAERFEGGKWNLTPKEQRYKFVKNFLESQDPIGKDKKYIINNLGKPDGDYRNYISYIVKNFDPEECIHGFIALLHFDIDAEGVVEKAFIRLD